MYERNIPGNIHIVYIKVEKLVPDPIVMFLDNKICLN